MTKTTLLPCLALMLSAAAAHAECDNFSWWDDLEKRGISIASLPSVRSGTPQYAEILRAYRAHGCARSDLDRDIEEGIRTAENRRRAVAGDGRFCDRKRALAGVSLWSVDLGGFTSPGSPPKPVGRRKVTYEEALGAYYDSGCTQAQLDADIQQSREDELIARDPHVSACLAVRAKVKRALDQKGLSPIAYSAAMTTLMRQAGCG